MRRLLSVCQTRSLPVRLKLQNKQIGLFHRMCESVFQTACLLRALGTVASPELSCHLLQSQGTRNTSPTGHRAGRSVAAPGQQPQKTRAADTCAHPTPGDSGALEHGRGPAWRQCPHSGGSAEDYSGPSHACVSGEACPLGHHYRYKLVGCFHSRTRRLSLLLLVPGEW